MALIYNGSEINSLIYNGNDTVGVWNSVVVWKPVHQEPDYNPLGLPPNTVRVRTSDGKPPEKFPWQSGYTTYETATLVSGTTDVYDVYKSGTSFKRLLIACTNVIEVIGANTTGITDMSNMFASEDFFEMTLTSVPLFDTSKVTTTYQMFYNCSKLTSIPLFDTSNVTNMTYMFSNCVNVENGALALYKQASTQANPPTAHDRTFRNCGSNTVNGAAELAQIPSNWKE